MDTNIPSRDEVFMNIAVEISRLSKDPSTKVGSVIVSPDNRIIGTGYNGLLDQVKDTKSLWGWKHDHVIHAEINALKNSLMPDLYGHRVYVTLYPCLNCAKSLLRWGVEEIIFKNYREKYDLECENFFRALKDNVKIRKFPEED